MQKCSFGDSPLAAKQQFKQATVLNAFAITDRRPQELFKLKMVSSEKRYVLFCLIFNESKGRIEVIMYVLLALR